MDILLQIFLLHQSCLQKGDDFLGRNILISDFPEHLIVDTEKNNGGGLVQEIVLMDAVFVDEIKVSFLENDIFFADALPEGATNHIAQFNVIVGVALGFIPVFEVKAIAELFRRRIHGGTEVFLSVKIPAQEKDPFRRQQGIYLDFFY